MSTTFDGRSSDNALRISEKQQDGDYHRGQSGLGVGPDIASNEKSGAEPPTGPSLLELIESQVLPRLLLASEAERRDDPNKRDDGVVQLPLDPVGLAHLSLARPVNELVDHLERMIATGLTLDQVYQDLLTPAARVLGVMWENDECTFTDVTLGLIRLHQVLRQLAQNHRHDAQIQLNGRSAYFAPMPGEQHSFGLVMLEEYFILSGWRVHAGINPTADEIVDEVSNEHFDVIGFSSSQEHDLDSMTSLIRRTRKAVGKPNAVILVGGRVFNDRSEFASLVGADATARNGREAVSIADHLVSRAAATI